MMNSNAIKSEYLRTDGSESKKLKIRPISIESEFHPISMKIDKIHLYLDNFV